MLVTLLPPNESELSFLRFSIPSIEVTLFRFKSNSIIFGKIVRGAIFSIALSDNIKSLTLGMFDILSIVFILFWDKSRIRNLGKFNFGRYSMLLLSKDIECRCFKLLMWLISFILLLDKLMLVIFFRCCIPSKFLIFELDKSIFLTAYKFDLVNLPIFYLMQFLG